MNTKVLSFILSNLPANKIASKGEKTALNVYKEVFNRVPAYKKFLNDNNFSGTVNSLEDFKKLPITDKKNYTKKYNFEEVCLDGNITDKYLIDRSSGFSGEPSYWPSTINEDKDYPKYMEMAYQQFYGIEKKSTLMLITLALGSWIGGEKISWASREIAINGKNKLTVMTPGVNLEEILEMVNHFKDKYEQIVLVGYPPFVKRIIDEGAHRGIDWNKINIKLGLGGEGYSENWREYLRDKLGIDKNDLMAIAGGYGAADLGMSVAREYPISIMIRKLANENRDLAKDLFGEKSIPSLCQYVPGNFYAEQINNELVFTAISGIPSIRYNVHDRGGIISFNRALEICQKHGHNVQELLFKMGYTKKDIWRLPFIYIYGRSDGTAHFNGANIYVENIQNALNHPDIISYNSGNFHMNVEHSDKHEQNFIIDIELVEGQEKNEELNKKIKKTIIEVLKSNNSEYNLLHGEMKEHVHPKVNLHEFANKKYFPRDSIKNKYITPEK